MAVKISFPQRVRARITLAGTLKPLLRWALRLMSILLAMLIALGAAGACYQVIATARDAQSFPAPGQLVDVGSYKMHINCTGSGSPTVILEGGNANSSSVWAWIQPEIAKTTHVCSYDRAGVGWSEASQTPRDARTLAAELHTLLTKAGIPGPYVFVGHSFGGLVTRVYAAAYPSDVAGMVWLDVQHPEQWTRADENRMQYQQILIMNQIGPWFAQIGLLRLSSYFPVIQDLPPQAAAEFKAWVDTTRFMQINAAEFQAQPESMAQAAAAGSLGSLPLIVVTATDHGFPAETAPILEAQWRSMQNELAALSSNSIHRVVEGATHGSLQVAQHDAQISSSAVREVIEAVRSGVPLATR